MQESMNHLVYAIVALSLISGFFFLIAVTLFWDRLKGIYQSWYCKGISEIARFGTVVLGVSAWTDSFKLANRSFCIVGFGLSYLLWVLASLVGDYKKTVYDKNHNENIAEMQDQIDVVTNQMRSKTIVLSSVKEIMTNKKQKIWDQIRRIGNLSKTKAAQEQSLRLALDPKYQSEQIVVHLALFLRDQLPQGEARDRQNFRVAFYISEGGFLKPFASFDLERQAYDFLRAFRDSENHFRLGCVDRPSHAARCIDEDQMLIVEDCPAEVEELHPEQFRYLKSMVAYPIRTFGNAADHQTKACIVVDTNVVGHFKKSQNLEIESYMEQFAVRLDLEFSVYKLLDAKPSLTRSDRHG